jgi:ketosteroid isomerase-like protein
MSDRLTRWMDDYRRAWSSNDPADIGALFTDDAAYYTAPFRTAWRGREEIIKGWIEIRDDPDGFPTFAWSPLVETSELAIVQGVTAYPDTMYSNLWVIRFDADGRSREFTEWFMDQAASPDG